MKKVTLFALITAFILGGCASSDTGELTGVQGRKKFYEPEPFEMAFIPAGSFTMGPSDQDPLRAMNSLSKTVTVEAFWMDQTEITNNKYRQFTYWVRDSILRTRLGDEAVEGYEFFRTDEEGNVIEPHVLNWDEQIDLEDENIIPVVETMFYPPEERFNGNKQWDTRLLNYSYFWVDYKQAAKAKYNLTDQKYEGSVTNLEGISSEITDRSSFIMHHVVNIFPDTLAWIRDFTYSFNEPWA
ncbi:MAG: SUMF1/EgtB/PvdO family nonheme iron enzyme, partial [Bacteroidales bacterium]|nr:SUMF1/EgtB/PvdO family nonheme iron enzyme [Bacteroidales bacterium]